jgi:hypothetical protein
MEKSYKEGIEEGKNIESRGTELLRSIKDAVIKQMQAETQILRKKLLKHELLVAIREEATSFSVNTKTLLEYIDQLAELAS